jgi:hypothetical protein
VLQQTENFLNFLESSHYVSITPHLDQIGGVDL